MNLSDLDFASAGNLLTNVSDTANRLTDGIDGIYAIKSPQMNYMWDIEILNPYLSANTNELRLYAQSTAIPSVQVETIKRYFAGVEYTYKGRDISARTFRLNMFDNEEMVVYSFFDNWKRLMFKGEQKASVSPNNYMFDIILNLKDVTDSKVTKTFIMKDAFPSEISESEMNYTESGMATFDVVMSFQSMEVI